MTKKKKPVNNTNIPQYAIDRLARCFYPDIVAFYETEEGKRILQELKQQSPHHQTAYELQTTPCKKQTSDA